jgi:hypothetical protein
MMFDRTERSYDIHNLYTEEILQFRGFDHLDALHRAWEYMYGDTPCTGENISAEDRRYTVFTAVDDPTKELIVRYQ